MGLFGLIKSAIPTSHTHTVYIDHNLGNVLLAGSSVKGMNTIMTHYGIDALDRNSALIIFRDAKNGFASYSSITKSGSMIYEISNEDGAITQTIDAFSCFAESEINSYLIDLFDGYCAIDGSKRMSYQKYIALIRGLLKKRSRTVKLKEFANYPFAEVERLNHSLPMSDAERDRNTWFLNSFLPDVRELESYFDSIASSMLGEVLSGNRTMEKVFQTKEIIEISLDFTSKKKESELLMRVIIDNICKMNPANAGKDSITVIANEIPNDVLINASFEKLIKNTRDCNVLYTVVDLASLVEKSNEWIEYADSYFFFKQNSNRNKEFCSEFFGTYERTKESRSKGTTNPTLWTILSGQSHGSTTNTTVSYTTEKERVYLPDVFANLPENQAIYFLKNKNEHSRLNVY